MKKGICLLVILIIILLGCKARLPSHLLNPSKFGRLPHEIQNESVHFSIKTEAETFTPSIKKISYVIANNGPSTLFFGSDFYVEKYQEDKWWRVPFIDQMAFTSIGILVDPGKSYTQSFVTKVLKYRFTEGQYRIVKPISLAHQKVNFTVAAEFRIKK